MQYLGRKKKVRDEKVKKKGDKEHWMEQERLYKLGSALNWKLKFFEF